MPKLTGPLFSVEARKTLGKMLTYQRRPGGPSVYGYKKSKIPLTNAQLFQRELIRGAVKWWQGLTDDEKAGWADKAKGQGQSGYSYFLKQRVGWATYSDLALYLPLYDTGLQASSFRSRDANSHLVEVTQALWTSQGRYFDGQDDYVIVGDTASFKFLHGALDTTAFKFTIAFWMSLPVPEPDAIWGLLGTATWSAAQIGITIGYDDRSGAGKSRDLTLHIERGEAGYVLQFDTNNNLYPNDSDFHLVAFTYDQALGSGNMNFYIDAVLKATANKTGSAPSTANSSQALNIGSRLTTTQPANATIGEVWIGDRVLTIQELDSLLLATQWRYS